MTANIVTAYSFCIKADYNLSAAKVHNFSESSGSTFLNNLLHAFCECHIAADALGGQLWIVSVKADEGGVWKLCGHLLEGEADDDGSVEAHAKF